MVATGRTAVVIRRVRGGVVVVVAGGAEVMVEWRRFVRIIGRWRRRREERCVRDRGVVRSGRATAGARSAVTPEAVEETHISSWGIGDKL